MQPQPGALTATSPAEVGESIEQLLLILAADSRAGVQYADTRYLVAVRALGTRCDHHAPGLGELDGVVGEVDEDLAQGAAIGAHGEWIGRQLHAELQSFVVG